MITREVSNISELIDVVMDTDSPKLWFRGMRCSDWHLEPSLWRHLKRTNQQDLTIEQLKIVEVRLLTRFRQQSLPHWPAGYTQSSWEHLFMMQHHGVPTRLLDWTTNLLAALYFALTPPQDNNHEHSCKPTIWVLDPVKMNKANKRFDGFDHIGILASTDEMAEQWSPGNKDTQSMGPEPIAMYGLYNSDRIASQQGVFTVSGKVLTPIDELDAAKEENGYLRKIILPKDTRSLTANLNLLGVSESTVYPGLSTFARDLTKEELG